MSVFIRRLFSPLLGVLLSALSAVSHAETLKIGYSDWPGWVAWEVGIEKGWFEEAGVDVQFEWFDYVASMDAFAAGNTRGPKKQHRPLSLSLSLICSILNFPHVFFRLFGLKLSPGRYNNTLLRPSWSGAACIQHSKLAVFKWEDADGSPYPVNKRRARERAGGRHHRQQRRRFRLLYSISSF